MNAIKYRCFISKSNLLLYKKIFIIFFFVQLSLSFHSYGQPLTVTGTILPAPGAPVPFSTITLKRTDRIVTSNNEGIFNFPDVKPGDTLTISSVGYETDDHRITKKAPLLIIQLKATSKELEEVEIVNTGYQRLPKERATGSFDFIDNKTLNQQVGTNILKRIEGVSSGILFDNNKLINGQIKNDNIDRKNIM
mgnify:CR=1 FL=1